MKASIASVVLSIIGVALVAIIGGRFNSSGSDWYKGLLFPSWKPPDRVFPIAWTIIFILCAVSIILIWNAEPRRTATYITIGLFVINGGLNILWSALFFRHRLILQAAYEAGLLCLTVAAIILVGIRLSPIGALLLLPYALWTAFATALTFVMLIEAELSHPRHALLPSSRRNTPVSEEHTFGLSWSDLENR